MAIEQHPGRAASEPLLAIRDLTLQYNSRTLLAAERPIVKALDRVSLNLYAGKTLAIVGLSGSGKSSLARCMVALERPSSGEILFAGQNLFSLKPSALKSARRNIHLIFQDSASALNPSLSVEEILAEPIEIHESGTAATDRRRRMLEAMEQVELPPSLLANCPLELSGGQRQRVAIARALMLHPKILILDEALASLDVSTQNQIANLLLQLQRQHATAYAFITHDFAMAAALAHEAVVLREGRILERASCAQLITFVNEANRGIASTHSPAGETVSVP
jgi:ABC-type glutathione transport system ATPase component